MSDNYREAIEEARELTRRNGYSPQGWMRALNLATGNNPERLRRASAILSGLIEEPTIPDKVR